MGLIKCPDCGNMVSERAEMCPSCGCPASVFKPDFTELVSAHISFHLLKCFDREDLILANDMVAADLRERLRMEFPVTVIGSCDLKEYAAKVAAGEFSFPCVFVTSGFRYMTGYRKFPLARIDGRTYLRYYDDDILPCSYGPVIEIFSDDGQQADLVSQKIEELFKEPRTYMVPFAASENDCLQLSAEIGQINDTELLIDSIETKLFRKTIAFKQSQWACLKGINDTIGYESMKTLRDIQLAQFSLYYAAMKDDCGKQLDLYDFIFNGARSDVPYQSKEYKTLKNLVIAGQPFDSDLCDEVFPEISLIYHALPNDLLSRTHVDAVREKVYATLSQYENIWKSICDRLDLPGELDVPDWDYSGLSNNMRSTDGLEFLIDMLAEDHTRKISDIVDVYKEVLAYRGQEGRMESEQRFDDFMDMLHERREKRRDFAKGVLQTAAGVVLGNKISDKLKKRD